MSPDVTRWHYCADSDFLQPGQLKEVTVEGRLICILRRGEQVFACSALCPHSGGRLCAGWLDARGRIVCPDHKYRFEPSNGYNASGEGYKLKTFPVLEEEGRIFVQF